MADATYQPKTYRMNGGDRHVIASGGSMDVESGGEIDIESGGALKIAGTAVTSTAAELNALDGITATVAELNILDGVTSTAAELNILDGVTATATELNLIDGSVAGTAVASKAAVLGANKNLDVLAVADLKLGAGAGTSVTSTATELNLLDGATATTAELNLVDNMPSNITFAAAAAASTVCEVTCTVVDAAAAAIAGVFNFDIWLSDAATGAGLTGTTASGTVTVKAASGAVIGTNTAKKALRVQTLATGVFILEITDTAKTGFYVAAALPSTGATKISAQLVTGNYGA